VRDTDKAAALLWLLREGLPKKSPTLVFASTRHHVEYLTLLLSLEGVEVCAVHGSMDQVRGFGLEGARSRVAGSGIASQAF
jgi:ATP-dependent RNA helicase DDX54/DBP10